MSALSSLWDDYSAYLKNEPDGTIDFAGGKLTKKGSTATYDPGNGQLVTLSTGTDPYQIYKSSPEIAKAWESTYGKDVFSDLNPNQSEQNYISYVYGSPNSENKQQYTELQPAIDALNENAGPRSGLPEKYQTQLLDSVIPKLTSAVDNYRNDINASTEKAGKLYQGIADQTLKKNLQTTLNDLAKKNVLTSSVASDALAKAGTDAALTSAMQAYQQGIDTANLQANIPTILTNIASLGSSSTNDLAAYELLSNMLLNA